MKKHLAALAAMTLVTLGAQAVGTTGDICILSPMPNNAAGYTYPNQVTPHKLGDEIYFIVRLLTSPYTDAKHPKWEFKQSASGALIGNYSREIYWPKLRIAIGAKKVWADYSPEGPNGETQVNAQYAYYTDLYFKYTVQEGDLGLPIYLVDQNDNIISDSTQSGVVRYGLANVNTEGFTDNYWDLCNADGLIANFSFSQEFRDADHYPIWPYNGVATQGRSAMQPNVYVQTVDFEESYADAAAKIWRDVYAGLTENVDKAPKIVAKGGVSGSIYVWSDNDDVVTLDGAYEEVSYNVGGTMVTRRVFVVSYGEDLTFKLKGGAADKVGQTATLHMCSYKEPARDSMNNLIPGSTVTRTVRLIDAPPPFLTLCDADDNATFKAIATNPVKAVQMKLKLSAAYTDTFAVNLGLKVGTTTVDPIADKYVVLLKDEGDPTTVASISSITVPANTTEVYFYLYALGSCSDIKSNGITITPSIDAAAYPGAAAFFASGEKKFATVKPLTDQKPIVSASLPSSGYKGDTINVDVTVDDNWRDLQAALATAGYKVVINLGGSRVCESNAMHFAEGTPLSFPVTIPNEGTLTGSVQVWDPMNNQSDSFPITIEANAPLTAYARTFSSTSIAAEPDADPTYVEGQNNVYVRGVLSSAASFNMYAFIVPMDAASSNLVETTAVTNGLAISSGDVYSGYARLTLKDGNATDGCKVNLGLVLKDKQDFNDPAAQVIGTYSTLSVWGITVTNAVPRVEEAWGGDDTNRYMVVNGGTYSGRVSATAPVVFKVQVADPGALDLADRTNPIRVRWGWTDGPVDGQYTQYRTTEIDEKGVASCPFTFDTDNVQQTITVNLQDRDMKAVNPNKYGTDTFSFKVKVGDVPSVIVEYPSGNVHGIFYETSNNSKNYIVVKVSEWPTDQVDGRQYLGSGNPLKVKVALPDEFDPGDNGVIYFNDWKADGSASGKPVKETVVTFKDSKKATKTGEKIFFDLKSQNGGNFFDGSEFQVLANVTTETQASTEQKWSEYFASATVPVRMTNVEPTIDIQPDASDTAHNAWAGPGGTNEWTAGETVILRWTVTDTARDVTNKIARARATIAWTLTDMNTNTRSVNVSDSKETLYIKNFASASQDGLYKFTVPNSEYTEVKLTVNDGDDGKCEYVFYIHVIPTKNISITPFGPASSSKTRYMSGYGGIGRGHVYVVGSTEQYLVRQFVQTWNYAETMKQAELWAAGYPATNQVAYDNGELGKDAGFPIGAALTSAGGKWESAAQARYNYGLRTDPYDNGWKYDSYFYCWAKNVEDEWTYELPAPTLRPENAQQVYVTLDNEKDENTGYGTVQAEAVFAREYLPSDNLGDINADGIPDRYAKQYRAMGAFDEAGAILDDQKSLQKFNDDEDYLPGDVDLGVSQENSRYDQWKIPFTAIREIRGWDPHLNDAPRLVNIKDGEQRANSDVVRTNPRTDENSTFSYLEYRAWLEAGSPDDWSPECPTDPTEADTDGDGYPDGYEYYFWYRAHVGYWVKNGSDDVDSWTHKYQTGYRYNAGNPFEPYIIPRETIEELFNPRVESHSTEWSTIDTDDDGLPDAEEFRLGTDPLHWDTDRDGLCDGWEVMMGLDPLDPADASANPDLDAMAEYETEEVSIIGLDGGQGYTEYYCLPKNEGFQYTKETNEAYVAQAVIALTWTTYGITTNYYLVSTNVSIVTYEHDGRTYLGANIARTDANEGIGNAATNLIKGLATTLRAGLWIAPPPFETVNFALGTAIAPKRCYRLMQYGYWGHNKYNGIMYVRTREYNGAQVEAIFNAKPCVGMPFRQTIFLQHYQVRQELGFDPRTGWRPGMTNTRPYTHFDEFMLMPYLQMEGALEADRVQAGVQRDGTTWTREMIWAAYCTAIDNADTDTDGMPDGWELYTMAPAPVYDEETGYRIYNYNRDYPYAPNFIYSPLPGYMNQDFLAEYCGLASCGYYEDNCATIINIDPHWTNKQWPTDPYSDDTDGDGIPDMEEKNYFYSGVAVAPGMGGGLNPCSWDTDGDFLPDPWEAEFAGTYSVGASTASDSTTVTADGVTNTTHSVTGGAVTFNFDGMDGTVNDAMEDYDHDGLMNWQEYLVGAQRCWRYDDTISIWGNSDPISDACPSDGYWCQLMLSQGYYAESGVIDYDGQHELYNPHLLVGGMYDIGANYFSLCTNVWDSACGSYYMFKDGIYHDLATPGDKWTIPGMPPQVCNRFTWRPFIKGYVTDGMPVSDEDKGLIPWSFSFGSIEDGDHIRFPKKYICCNPTKADTDNDGMDDYYELFHGLNPLLGASAVYDNGTEPAIDLIYEAYGGGEEKNDDGTAKRVVSATCNYWLNDATSPSVSSCQRTPRSGTFNRYMDFEAYPWLTGLADADVDGDNLRNQTEAIMPDIQAASTWLHTDPSPLWLTSSDYADSLTFRYYQVPDPNESVTFTEVFQDGFTDTVHGVWHPWKEFPILEYDPQAATLTIKPYTLNYWNVESFFLDFEENEGYDSDHDFLSDFEETQGKTKSASDPQDTDDPKRRQAMWFPGENALLETPLEVRELDPVDSLPKGVDLPFLYYTVECWAKPEGDLMRAQTLVERALYTGQSNMGDAKYLRKNFQIGINGGRWYTKYDSAGTDVLSPVEITDGPNATTNWTHIAATYDGEALRLYVNGVCVRQKQTGVQPEHNVRSIAMGEQGSLRSGSRSWTDQVAILVGASAADRMGIVFDWWPRYGNPFVRTSFVDYNNYFKGYIDEVRVWDGARTASDILSDYKTRKRYTAADAEANRQAVFEAWVNGYQNRAPSNNNQLPPELKRHWTFDHLPGAVKAEDVETVPGGFDTAETVTDAKAIWSRPEGWRDGWWGQVPVASSIYTDRAFIPWIIDTVGHLPRFDLTTLDSKYWSDDYAGWTNAAMVGFNTYVFPRTHEPTVRWTQIQRKGNSGESQLTYDARYSMIESISDETTHDALFDRYVFNKRHRLREGFDLLPLGGAYPKRISEAEGGMWDDGTAADAWAQTGSDVDNNGLPDWWETYARQNYCKALAPSEPLKWESPVDYHGVTMPAWRAYLTDLSKGQLPDGTFDDNYADKRDLDGDGMPDWWEDMYGIDTQSKDDARADPDCDGLSNYQEYLISQRDGLFLLDPTLAHSATDDTLDYFLQAKNAQGEMCYLGELYADHDFMEDLDEDVNGLDRTKYDAWSDADEDGWSAWSEMRYSNFKMTIAQKFLSHLAGIEEVKDFPIPVIHATLRYNGENVSAETPIVVQAFSGNNILKKPTATFTVTPGTQETRHLYLGMYENRVFHGTLAPGWLVNNYNKISLQVAHAQSDDLFSWTIDDQPFRGTYAEMYAAFTLYGTKCQIAAEEFDWADVLYTGGSSGEVSDDTPHALTISDVDATMKGHLMIINKRVGNIDLTTGDFDLDLSALSELYMGGSSISMQQYFYRLEYQTQIPTLQKKSLQISLSNPDSGNLTEGTTAFVAFLDTDGNGTYTPGVDPVGFVKDVEVGWDKVPELTIEMTDASQAAGKRFSYGDDVETLRIVRTAINGSENNVKRRIVYSREASDAARNYVFEGDMVAAAKFGLDWTNLRKDVEAMEGVKVKDLTSVTYMVVSGAGSVQKITADSALDTFTVTYTAEPQKPTAYSPSVKADGIVETARPTFKWSGSSGYTCFRLQIADNLTKKIVYSSPLSVLPPRDASLRYTWTAPVSIGTNVCNDAWALDNNRTYQWRVAMYNAKFSETNDADSAWSDWAEMKTQLATANNFKTRRGCADVTVRYYGPATNDLADVIVQLYRNADFAGEPAAQTRLYNVDGVATNLAHEIQTVRFCGLEAGDYYAVAFIDRNHNSKRDRYETWGYSAQVGLTLAAIWRNAPVTVDPDSSKIPEVDIYMEDTDINGDDVLDWNQDIETYLAAAATATTAGADVTDTDLDGLGKDIETGESYTNPEKWDTDGDGLPDGWEYSFAGTDPLDADADTVIAGDVMAYAEIKRTVITVKSQATGAKTDYALAADEVAPTIGSNVNGHKFYALYDYGSVKGLGQHVEIQKTADYQFAIVSNTLTAVTNHCLFARDLPLGVGTNLFEETAWKALGPDAEGVYQLGDEITLDSKVSTGTNTVVSVKPAKVSLGENRVDAVAANQTIALVHAQVFDAFGFNQKTAIAANDAVNTKAFTALDKYLLIRYFQAIGVKEADEEKMNVNRRWSEFTLPPNDTDYDRDGIADGWELYVMFGPKSVTNAVSIAKPAEAAVSPWNYADRASDLDGESLPLVGEYNLGKSPTNPWNKYTLNDSIDDLVAQRFDIATGTAQLEDNDHDGLSNWAEYLLWRARHFSETNRVDDAYSLATERGGEYALDYFARVKSGTYKGWYAGELPDEKGTHLVADHDFIEDWWEDLYDVGYVNRYLYDFYGDKDGDGWSNWSEARVDSDPTLVASLGIDSLSLAEYPVPLIETRIYSDSEKISSAAIVFMAWKDSLLRGTPDARWSTTLENSEQDATDNEETDDDDSKSKLYIGRWKNRTAKFYMSPGSIAPGSVVVRAKGSDFGAWGTVMRDLQDSDDKSKGLLMTAYYLEREVDYGGGVVSNEYIRTVRQVGTINYATGEIVIDYPSIDKMLWMIVDDMIEYVGLTSEMAYYRLYWTSAIPGKTLPAKFYLSYSDEASTVSKGHVREGNNNIVAFADLNGDGIYTVGEPLGFIRNVSIGWDKVPELGLSLSTYSSVMPRINLASGSVAGDRDVTIPTNEVVYADAVNKQRVKIVRTSINGRPSNQVVFSRVMDFSQRTYLTEADIIRGNTFGLDWASLGSAAEKAGVAKSEIKTVEYRVILGDGSTKQGEANNVALTFVNTYDASRIAPYAVSPSTNSNYKLLSAQPTFNWTGSDSYTAYRIQIAAGGTNDANIVWSSGIRAMPALMPNGYSYVAPVYVGCEFTDEQGVPTGKWFEDGKTYFWRVTQYNSKYNSEEKLGENDIVWSDWASFRTATDSERADSGYGKVMADIRYYGNAANGYVKDVTTSNVIVEAYLTADFTGNPVARMRLGCGALENLAKTDDSAEHFMTNKPNVALDGLPPGDYYMLAYIDINTNGTREVYEPWGYACQVGKVQASEDGKFRIWEPETIDVKAVKDKITSAIIFIEDTDVNQNMTPDCLEDMSNYVQAEGSDAEGDEGGTTITVSDADADGLTATEEDEAATDPQTWDTDGDGMPDGWEAKFANTDPTDAADGTNYITGDVMAYLTLTYPVLRVRSTETGLETSYVVTNGHKYFVGDNLNGKQLNLAYNYSMTNSFNAGNTFGMGRAVTVAATADYKLAFVTNTVIGSATNYLFDVEAAIDVGTNVNGMAAWKVRGYEAGNYLRGAETNFPAAGTEKVFGSNTVLNVSTVKVSLGENRIVEIVEKATVALVHAQVYDYAGFSPKTCVATADAVNTKVFTPLDKYLVVRYLEALGLADEKAMNKAGVKYTQKTAAGSPWAKNTLSPENTDNDKDGIADGWELYVMFGTNTIAAAKNYTSAAATPINPWTYADARQLSPGGEGLLNVEEYDKGNGPTDPWNTHSFDFGDKLITDAVSYQYDLKTEERQLADNDNDGLSNWAEYLASLKLGVDFDVNDPCSVLPNVYDYFVKTDEGQYVGESIDADGLSLIADHDFMEDDWEDLWDPAAVFPYALYANKYVYDANLDGDEDGWKNWSECRAYHWGCGFYSDIIDTFINGNNDSQMLCVPQPAIGLKVTYNGRLDGSWKSLIVRTRTANSNYPDAIFQINSMRAEENEVEDDTAETTAIGGIEDEKSSAIGMQNKQVLGVYNGMRVMRGFITPGLIVPSAAKFEMTSVSQELTYHWYCTECGGSHHGNYIAYKTDMLLHGDQDQSSDGRGVKLEKTTVDWTTFATAGTATDGRHGKICLVRDNNLEELQVELGEIDYRTGEFSLNLEKMVKEFGYNLEGMAFQVVSSYNLGAYWPQTVWLSNAKKGYVKEGDNTIEAFLDLNGDCRYDIGEPYGILQHVNIGWHKTPEMRIELKDGTYAGVPVFEIESTDDTYDEEQSTKDQNQGITEGFVKQARIKVDMAKINATSNEYGVAEFTINPDGDCKGRLRIVRLNINGQPLSFNRTVCAKTVDVTYGKVFTLADFIRAGQIDLDARYLIADAATAEIAASEIKTVEYGVFWNNDIAPLYTFTRTFDATAPAPRLSRNYEDSYYKLLKDQPELTWFADEGYPAFVVQVSEDADFSTVLYAATNILPAAGADGITFKPDLYVGEELKDQTTYYWRVAQLNAKFPESTWSEVASFSTAVESKNADTGYGKLAAEIRYFGPATNALTNVVVGVYEAGDFCCAPVARKRLAGSGTIASLTNESDRAFTTISTNIVLDGIAPGKYYVMAFVDVNTNGVRDAFETWGYACKITTDEKDLWTPVTAEVVSVKKAPPKVLIVMEDTDVNQDMIPDCLQDMSSWAPVEKLIDSDGDGLTDTEEDDFGTDPLEWDSDDDGMPDGWEVKFAGTDPTDAGDATNCVPGDVMAYLELSYPVLRVQSIETGDESWYVVTDNTQYYVGDNVAGKTLPLAYSYNMTDGFLETGTFGMGREVTVPAGDNRIVEIVENAKVALVHAQVYDYAGFSSKTCVATTDAVNTKPFTALDKYLVARYLEAIGLGNEDEMNEAGVKYTPETASVSPWAKQTLSPANADNDKDGVADGWELYVMFGDASTKSAGNYASTTATPINPWTYADARNLAPGSGSELTVVQEYDNGRLPTNPWRLDTDEDGVRDYYAYYYHLKGDDRVADNDGDGLSNMAEYMISELFQFAKLDPDNPKTDGCCVDYFRKVSDLYFGEIFTDHDQVADAWERLYPGYASDVAFDGLDDPDHDGWSNYAEARCGTDPTTDASVGLDNYQLPEYPVPTIEMTVVYNGNQALINRPLVVKAWNQAKDAYMTGAPDANWTIGATGDNAASQTEGAAKGAGEARVLGTVERSKYLGAMSSTTVTINLGPGSVVPNSLQIQLRNPIYEAGSLVNGQFVSSSEGLSSSAKWYVCLEDDGLGTIKTVADQLNKRETVGTINYATGKMVVDFSQLTGTVILSGSSGEEDNVNDKSAPSYVRFDLDGAHVLLVWTTANSGSSAAGTYYLSDPDNDATSRGHVREGLTSFVVFVGDDSGNYEAGAPFGFVRDVDVGWQGAKFTVELSEMNAITPRILLWEDECDRANVVDETVTMNLYDRLLAKDPAAAATYSNSYVVAGIENDQARLRIVRFGVNDKYVYNIGAGANGGLAPRIVVDRTFDKNGREYLHEGDFLQNGEYDIDWSNLYDEVVSDSGVQDAVADVTNVTYLVVLEGGKGFEYWVREADPDEVDDPSTRVHRLATTIERRFEVSRSKPRGEGVSGFVYGSCPTFTWSIPDEEAWAKKYGSSYTAFNLKITDTSSKQVVWESGLQRAPAVVDGKFTWTAPVYFGDQTSKGKMLSATGSYSWQVSMYNAKWPYRLTASGSEAKGSSRYSDEMYFSSAVNSCGEMNDRGSSSIAVAVKYAGPATVLSKVSDLAVTLGKVRVQAFERADFAGEPVAETVATEKIADTAIMTENARLIGLPALGTYYVRAYIDLNGNLSRDPWEPWGYAKEAVELTTETVRAPLVGLYIEDTDLDGDWLPDAWEYAEAGWTGEWNAIKKIQEASVNTEGKILFSADNLTHAENYTASFPSDMRGVTLTMFENGSFVTTLLGGGQYNWTIQAIRESVAQQVEIRENSVKVTGLSLDYATGEVHIFVDAEVAPSIAGEVVGRLYGLTDMTHYQKDVKVRVYTKTTLAQEGWTVLGEIPTKIGVDSAEVVVSTGLSADQFKSGFFKVEIVE